MSAAFIQHARAFDGQPLGNGHYATFLTAAGTGYSAWGELALTRWNADRIEDGDGFFLYLRDLDSGAFWSIGQLPVPKAAEYQTVRFSASLAELRRRDENIEAWLEVCVPIDADLELRRVTLRNFSDHPRRIELTSYAEVVLNTLAADAAHPAFFKLFVQTEWAMEPPALLARRRPRASDKPACWLVHALAGEGQDAEPAQYETDRTRFIGRGYTLAAPRALLESKPQPF